MSLPSPPRSVSAPLPPEQGIVAALPVERRLLGIGEDAVRLVDPDEVVALSELDDDLVELAPVEGEVLGAVVVDVDLEHRGCTRLQAERDLIVPDGAADGQDVVLDLRFHRTAAVLGRVTRGLRREGRAGVSGRDLREVDDSNWFRSEHRLEGDERYGVAGEEEARLEGFEQHLARTGLR